MTNKGALTKALEALPTIESGPWNTGGDFLPFHRQASHVSPAYRDGWNDCYEMARAYMANAALQQSDVSTQSTGQVDVSINGGGIDRSAEIDRFAEWLGEGEIPASDRYWMQTAWMARAALTATQDAQERKATLFDLNICPKNDGHPHAFSKPGTVDLCRYCGISEREWKSNAEHQLRIEGQPSDKPEGKAEQQSALTALTEQAEALDMGYGTNACPTCGRSQAVRDEVLENGAKLPNGKVVTNVYAAYREGLEEAAKWVDERRFAFEREHGSIDPSTGFLEFGTGQRAQLQEEYAAELAEIAEGIRSLQSTERKG
jgi:hypothetical protein